MIVFLVIVYDNRKITVSIPKDILEDVDFNLEKFVGMMIEEDKSVVSILSETEKRVRKP